MSITTEEPPVSLGSAIFTGANFLAGVGVAGDYVTQISQGDYEGARHTAESAALVLAIARVDPALTIPLVAVGARSEYVNNRQGIERRANWVGDLVNPFGINESGGATVAGLYAALESTGRALVSPVVKGVTYLSRFSPYHDPIYRELADEGLIRVGLHQH